MKKSTWYEASYIYDASEEAEDVSRVEAQMTLVAKYRSKGRHAQADEVFAAAAEFAMHSKVSFDVVLEYIEYLRDSNRVDDALNVAKELFNAIASLGDDANRESLEKVCNLLLEMLEEAETADEDLMEKVEFCLYMCA